MNRDIRLSVGFFDHPKIIKLERQLGYEGVIALIRLWLWVAQNRPSGLLSGMDDEDIAIAARWNGEVTAFKDVITRLRLLDVEGDTCLIHDWQEHNTWQSEAENRSNASRLSRMAKTHPDIYKILEQAGIKGISREEYGVITASNDPQAIVERWLTSPLSPFLTSPLPSLPFSSSSIPEEEREPSLRSDSLSGPHGPDEEVKTTSPKREKAEKAKALPPAKALAFPPDSPAYCLAVMMRDTLQANVPTLKEPDVQKWAYSFDVALRNDERMANPNFVAEVIKWACADSFWRANIQSPEALRRQFDKLTARMEAQAKKVRTGSETGDWLSPAQRRVLANQKAGEEAERLLFGNTTMPAEAVLHDAS